MYKGTFFVAVGLLVTVACVDPTGPLLGDESCDDIDVLRQVAGSDGGDAESYDTAGGDHDGDGDVDRVDSSLDENYLRLWESAPQSSESAGVVFRSQVEWSRSSTWDADRSTKRSNVDSCVAKFSDVAVSW